MLQQLQQQVSNEMFVIFDSSERFKFVNFIIESKIIVNTTTFNKLIFFNISFKRASNLTYLIFDIDFQLIDELLYHVKKDYSKFCIFNNCVHDILKLTHDNNFHVDHHRVYVKLKSIYIRKLSKQLTNYIRHCSFYQLNQIKRDRSYDEFMSINTSHLSYHTIIINFVLILFK